MEGLRKRLNNNEWKTSDLQGKGKTGSLPAERSLRQSTVLLLVAFHGVLFLIVHCKQSVYPSPLGTDTPSDLFSEERARNYLRGIVSVGSRLVGSYANEKLTVDYLLSELDLIKRNVNRASVFEVDSRRVSGSFTLGFLAEFTSAYHHVNNVVARLSPSSGHTDALLVNCHYDSAIGSPGKLCFYTILDIYSICQRIW